MTEHAKKTTSGPPHDLESTITHLLRLRDTLVCTAQALRDMHFEQDTPARRAALQDTGMLLDKLTRMYAAPAVQQQQQQQGKIQ